MVKIDWDDIQGNVLRGYGFAHARHIVLTAPEPRSARSWLRTVAPTVTAGTPWTAPPTTTLNLAFTHRGLAAFGLGPQTLASFPDAFRQGMVPRATPLLGDTGTDAPEHWEPGHVHDPSAHVLAMVHGNHEGDVEDRATRTITQAQEHGFGLVSTQTLQHLPQPEGTPSWKRLEHFGFADGVSQPAVEGAIAPTTIIGNGTPLKENRWRPIRPGEFVLGYPDEEQEVPPLPSPLALVRNGSYLVYRKLAQDVAAYRRLTAERARHLGVDADLLGAKIVGRHADGQPLSHPGDEHERSALNDVRFGDDPAGAGCPVGSHIRRANPRDAFGLAPELVSRHRLLRRGMPYGPPLPDGEQEDDGTPRGLILIAYCASISRQFEFVQREWLNDGGAFGAGHTQDPISGVGTAPRRFAFETPDGSPVLLGDLPRLVRTMGGDYLFQPGLSGLAHLASQR